MAVSMLVRFNEENTIDSPGGELSKELRAQSAWRLGQGQRESVKFLQGLH